MSEFEPVFTGPIEGWVKNQLHKGILRSWRVQHSMNNEEVMQEAYIVFLKCKEAFRADTEHRSPGAVFMALFKRSWANHFADLSTADTKLEACELQGDEFRDVQSAGALDNDGYLKIMMEQAPQEVKAVVSLFLNAPSELLELASKTWSRHGRYSPNGKHHVNAMLGLDPSIDPIKMVEDYFTK